MTESKSEKDRMRFAELDRLRLSRLELVKRGGITALMLSGTPALLAACGGGKEEGAATSTPSEPSSTEPLPPESQAQQALGTIDFLWFEGYDLPVDSMTAWKEANGVDVNPTYIATNDDIPAKIKSGGGEGIDLIGYTHGFKDSWEKLGLMTPLDEARIPNLKNLEPFFGSDVGNWWVDADGTRVGVPWTWGSVGLTYDSAVFTSAPTSYDILFEPEYKGKIVVVDDPIGSYVHAARLLGLEIAKLSDSDLAKINDWLREVVKQAKTVAASYGDAATILASDGEVVLAWSGWAAMNSFAKAAGKDTIKTTLPPGEGGYSFADAWAIPPGADNLDATYAWINQSLDATVNAEAADYLIGGVTVSAAVDLLAPDTRALYDYANIEAVFELAPFDDWPPAESDEYVTYPEILSAWTEVKATA